MVRKVFYRLKENQCKEIFKSKATEVQSYSPEPEKGNGGLDSNVLVNIDLACHLNNWSAYSHAHDTKNARWQDS